MKHRHLNIKEGFPLEAIDDIILRGDMSEWLDLRDYAIKHSEIIEDVIKICRHYISDPYEQK